MKHLPLLMIVLFLMPQLAGCSGEAETSEGHLKELRAIQIFTTSVRKEAIVDPIVATGEVIADKETRITPRVDGVIDHVYVNVGDKVQLGQPLFMTRQADFENRVMQLEQSLNLAEAELAQSIRQFKRTKSLRERDVVSQGRLDQVATGYNIARAKLGIAQANLVQARQALMDTLVTAPYDGVVTARLIDEGKMLTVITTTPVVEVIKLDIVEVIVRVPASQLARLSTGTRAKLDIDGMTRPIESQIHVLNDRVDSQTRTVEIRLRIDNSDLSLKPGMFAKATLYPKPRDAIVVARGAVQGIVGDQFVYVPDAGIAKRRTITARDVNARFVEILEGLDADQVVLTGPNLPDVSDGTPINLLVRTDGPR